MKKIIVAILALSITSITQAAYTIKIPLEQSNGGALPNKSINFKNDTPVIPDVPAPDEGCFHDESVIRTYIFEVNQEKKYAMFYWHISPPILSVELLYGTELYMIGNYIYRRGALQWSAGGLAAYEICRYKK
ncbi:hypothetical protein ACW9H6_20600 [Pseudomonas sp. SDO528_S397]